MKIRFFCDSGANIKSCRREVMDTEDIGYTAEEWRELTEDDKQKAAEEWAWDRLEIGFEEIEDDA
jgi:hypothetical protein